jgi:hypothetical protein
MKFNEPIRPAGIGRQQVAFDVDTNPSEYNVDAVVNNEQTIIDTSSDVSYSTLAKAKASAEATATSLKQDMQNTGFEITGINDFYFNAGSVGVDIPWNQTRNIVSSPLYWYNWYDRYIYVRKPGWYFVKAFFFAPEVNAGHEWGIKLVSNVTLNSPNYEVYSTYMDYRFTSKHPQINGSTLFNAPEQAFKNNGGGLPGFKIRLYSSNSNVSFNSFNTYANLQVFRLSDLEHSTRLIL